MKAILTNDGSIKIILPTEDPKLDSKNKEKFLSKEILCSETCSTSRRVLQIPINLKKPDISNGEAGDKITNYIAPRQVFSSTTCHVIPIYNTSCGSSLNILYFPGL